MTFVDDVEAALRQLARREEHVLRLRFGIGDTKLDIDGVAAWLSLAPTAVRRIESSALRKLRLAAVMEADRARANAG